MVMMLAKVVFNEVAAAPNARVELDTAFGGGCCGGNDDDATNKRTHIKQTLAQTQAHSHGVRQTS